MKCLLIILVPIIVKLSPLILNSIVYTILGNFRGDLIIIVGLYPGTVGRYHKQSVIIAQKYQN